MSTAAASGAEWDIFNSITVLIVGCCVVLIAVVLLLICIGTKKRLMSVRSNFVPVLSQAVGTRQKKFILDEHRRETEFDMVPPPAATHFGWMDEAAGEDLQRQVRDVFEKVERASKQLERPREPHVVWERRSSHAQEWHLGTLVVRSALVVEQHARAISSELARDAGQDVATYLRQLQSTLHLDKRVCDRYVAWHSRVRWSGPLRSLLTISDWMQFLRHFRELLAQIDAASG